MDWKRRSDEIIFKEFSRLFSNSSEEIPMKELLNNLPSDVDNIDRILNWSKDFSCDHNLNYTDKMSMSAGVEVRVPFLDKDLVNYVSVMPSKYKQKGKQGKWILKQIMKQYLPKDVIYRSKSGFGVPLRKWLKDELSDWLLEVLSKKNIKDRGLFNPIEVHNLIEKNKKGEVDGTYTLFSLACIEIWCRKFL